MFGLVYDKEVISVMVNGGERLCDEAIKKWYGGEYGQERELIRENIQRWLYIKRRIRELASLLRKEAVC